MTRRCKGASGVGSIHDGHDVVVATGVEVPRTAAHVALLLAWLRAACAADSRQVEPPGE